MRHDLPQVRGEYAFDVPLKNLSSIGVGGPADVMFYPRDPDDLIHFCQNKPRDLPLIVLGNLTNTLVPDDGIRGCVVNLSRFMTGVTQDGEFVHAEAGIGLARFIEHCVELELACCEKLYAIPGTLGGAIAMNAGVRDFEVCWPMRHVSCVDTTSCRLVTIPKPSLSPGYRSGNIPAGHIVVSAVFQTGPMSRKSLRNEVKSALAQRSKTQPIGAMTCGCAFKNPKGERRAWELIREAGCEKLSVGGAEVSSIHANFLINTGPAKSSDFVELIGMIKERVLERTGVRLEEEVVII